MAEGLGFRGNKCIHIHTCTHVHVDVVTGVHACRVANPYMYLSMLMLNTDYEG